MTEHESIQAMLALAAAGALDPVELARVQQHAESCEMCRREFNVWSSYARGLSELPQPAVPVGLLERTRARILELSEDQREASAAQRREALILAALGLFGWVASLTTWTLLRILSGGGLQVFGLDLVSGATWPLASTVFAWMTAATAVAMLGRRSELARTL